MPDFCNDPTLQRVYNQINGADDKRRQLLEEHERTRNMFHLFDEVPAPRPLSSIGSPCAPGLSTAPTRRRAGGTFEEGVEFPSRAG